MRGAIPPLPQYVFMAWCLVKHMDSFTFTYNYFVLYNVRQVKDRSLKSLSTFHRSVSNAQFKSLPFMVGTFLLR